uniref:Uncharacterized protein n=1 Tax=Kalanchoe fedtschenkoi TaxID=63787 RepID=A0A7N0V633_KALFE
MEFWKWYDLDLASGLGVMVFFLLGFYFLFFYYLLGFWVETEDWRRRARLTEESEHTQSGVQRVPSAGACSALCLSPRPLLLSFIPCLCCCCNIPLWRHALHETHLSGYSFILRVRWF